MAICIASFCSAGYAETYTLATGDRLRITLLENQQVNDTYLVEIDGTVSVPGIGVVSASGLGVREFESTLREKAADTIVDPSISVQIVEYRPFFVLGDVDAAGIYPFTPGLNAMKAVAIAGGFGRQIDTGELSRTIAENSARKSLAESQIELYSAKVNLARLEGERAMAETFEYEVQSDAQISKKAQEEIIASTQLLFETRQDAFRKQAEKMQASLAAREREIASFESQIALQNDVLKTSREELAKIRDARERGLVSDARINAIVRDEQNVRAQSLQIITLLRQSEVNKAAVEREIADLNAARAIDIDQSIQGLQAAIQRFSARAREDTAMLRKVGASTASSSSATPSYRLELHREGAPVDPDIAFDTPLVPGDTLLVILNDDAPASN